MVLDIATDRTFEARILIINLRGRIDALTAREFDDFFEELVRAGNRFFILQADRLEYVSSAGIGSLIRLSRRLRTLGGGAVLAGPSDEVRMLLDFFGLGDAVRSFADRDAAQAYLQDAIQRTDYSLEIERERVLRTKIHPHRKEKLARSDRVRREREGGASEPPSAEAPAPASSTAVAETADQLNMPEVTAAPVAPPEPSAPPEPARVEREPLPRVDELRSEAPEFPPAYAEEFREPAYPERAAERAAFAEVVDDEEDLEEFVDEAEETMTEARREQEHERPFAEARIVTCEQCGTTLRVYRAGPHMCPGCGIEFEVKRDGGVSFFEKL